MKRARWKDWLRDAVDWVVFPDIPKRMACGEEELADERLRLCEKCLEKFRQLELDPPIGEMKGYFMSPHTGTMESSGIASET